MISASMPADRVSRPARPRSDRGCPGVSRIVGVQIYADRGCPDLCRSTPTYRYACLRRGRSCRGTWGAQPGNRSWQVARSLDGDTHQEPATHTGEVWTPYGGENRGELDTHDPPENWTPTIPTSAALDAEIIGRAFSFSAHGPGARSRSLPLQRLDARTIQECTQWPNRTARRTPGADIGSRDSRRGAGRSPMASCTRTVMPRAWISSAGSPTATSGFRSSGACHQAGTPSFSIASQRRLTTHRKPVPRCGCSMTLCIPMQRTPRRRVVRSMVCSRRDKPPLHAGRYHSAGLVVRDAQVEHWLDGAVCCATNSETIT
jgi:hypothetical protein